MFFFSFFVCFLAFERSFNCGLVISVTADSGLNTEYRVGLNTEGPFILTVNRSKSGLQKNKKVALIVMW